MLTDSVTVGSSAKYSDASLVHDVNNIVGLRKGVLFKKTVKCKTGQAWIGYTYNEGLI